MYQIIHERAEDAPAINTLLDQCFGPERHHKTAYKVRANSSAIDALSFAGISNGELVASIKYWPLLIGNITPAILLGPIAVHPDRQGEGIGVKLIRDTMQTAKDLGHSLVVLVGDPEYYERFGYVSAFDYGLELPGPVDRHRFLVCELTDGALEDVHGMIMGV
ncbi:MAG: N-acetyltransferase [Sneathiella sp.]